MVLQRVGCAGFVRGSPDLLDDDVERVVLVEVLGGGKGWEASTRTRDSARRGLDVLHSRQRQRSGMVPPVQRESERDAGCATLESYVMGVHLPGPGRPVSVPRAS